MIVQALRAGLDWVGKRYEEGSYFLMELVLAKGALAELRVSNVSEEPRQETKNLVDIGYAAANLQHLSAG